MIRIEDEDFTDFSLTEGDIAVPIEILRRADEPEPEITVYGQFLPIAEEFVRLYGDEPFSDEAILFLKRCLTAPMREYGFSPSRDIDSRIRLFRLDDAGRIPASAILPQTKIVSGADGVSALCNLTTHALEMDPEDPDDISAVCLTEGAIAAYATENDAIFGEEEIEISVECAPAFRGQGLATSCAALLSDELIRRGYTVTYKCRHVNASSAAVARKAGFEEIGMQYSFVCYRRE